MTSATPISGKAVAFKIVTAKLITASLMAALFAPSAFANVCGTDYQLFNPTTNGIDFVTVQSSETLRPCIVNMGFFVNQANNNLTYSRTVNSQFVKGQKRNDRIISADVSLGVGLTDRWDFGVNVPFVLNEIVNDDNHVANFERQGASEIKANTKYHIAGDETGGVAGILSVNQNLVEGNPFTGVDGGPTFNFELAADKSFGDGWAGAINIGYRKRNSGPPLANVPFVPMDDQWIYSLATSRLIASLDTKIIFEIYGSHVAKSLDQETDRTMNSLEGLIGFKHDLSQNIALHFGAARQLDGALGGPDSRLYAGLNWALGPICDPPKAAAQPMLAARTKTNEVDPPHATYQISVELLFEHNMDTIAPERLAGLDTFVSGLIKQGFQRLSVEGHTDSIGSVEYNLDLSKRRANFIRSVLIEKYKLPAAKIEARGWGPTKPVASNGNYQGRKKNRRVEFKVWRNQ